MTTEYTTAIEQLMAFYGPATYFGLECCAVSVTTLVLYDWIVTLSREVHLFWTRKARRLPAILYFSNKYLNVLAYVVNTLHMAQMSNKICINMAIMARLLLCLSLIPPAAFTVMRVYALTGSRWLSALVFFLSNVQFVVSSIGYHDFGIHSTAWGCLAGTAIVPSSPLGRIALIGNRVSAILADIILIAITWKFLPAADVTMYIGPVEGRKFRSLSSIMLCNGIFYFIVLSILNVLQLFLTVEFSILPDALISNLSYFTGPLSSVLVSHFLLDLQEAHQRVAAGLASDNPSLATRMSINLADALGSISATVGTTSNHAEDEDGQCAENDQ